MAGKASGVHQLRCSFGSFNSQALRTHYSNKADLTYTVLVFLVVADRVLRTDVCGEQPGVIGLSPLQFKRSDGI